MMLSRCALLSSSAGRALAKRRELTLPNLAGLRYMSVINISDLEATEKFTEINAKSVLYFTATWYDLWCCVAEAFAMAVSFRFVSFRPQTSFRTHTKNSTDRTLLISRFSPLVSLGAHRARPSNRSTRVCQTNTRASASGKSISTITKMPL